MAELKNLIFPFLFGGSIIAGVKFTATHLNNPALAAIIAATPIGLISIYFLPADKTIEYAENYFYITLILATVIMVFYLLCIHTKIDKNLVLLIVLGVRAGLILIKYLIQSRYNKKKD